MTTENIAKKSTFGMLSVVLGFLAFAAVIGHFFIGPVDPPPPIETSIAEKAKNMKRRVASEQGRSTIT